VARSNEARLTFREEHGAILEYASAGGHGRAISGELATALVELGKEIVALGVREPEIFELIGLFQDGFGPDLLSDMAVSILRERVPSLHRKNNQRVESETVGALSCRRQGMVAPCHA